MIPHFASDILNTLLSFLPATNDFSQVLQIVDVLFLISILFLSAYYVLGPRSFFKAQNIELGQDWWEGLQSSAHASLIIPPFCLEKLPERTSWTMKSLKRKVSKNLDIVSKNIQTVSEEISKFKESWRSSSVVSSSSIARYPSPTNQNATTNVRGRSQPIENSSSNNSKARVPGRRSKSKSKSKSKSDSGSSTSRHGRSRERRRSSINNSTPGKSKQADQSSGKVTPGQEEQITRISWGGNIYGVYNLPEDVSPLLVFVNGRSGGNQGRKLLKDLRQLLNPLQVFDVCDREQPKKALKQFSKLPRLRVLVCGGDGTVGWVLEELNQLDTRGYTPPVGVLPLGTGNDMARALGWGPGYEKKDRLEDVLLGILHAHVVMLDRWTLRLEPTSQSEEAKRGKRRRAPRFRPKERPFHNYFSVGVDAQTALRFHSNRESMPGLFFSRFINKLWYMVMGTEQALRRSCADLREQATLVCDGKEIPIPEKAEGIIFLNINSYGGGVSMWRSESQVTGQDRYEQDESGAWQLRRSLSSGGFGQSSFQDGKLDVVAVYGAFHLGQLQVGLSQAVKVCQCREAELVIKRPYPMQIDGEPWAQQESRVKISSQQNQAYMLAKTGITGGQVATEMTQLLDWAVKTDVINCQQRETLMKEFSRRIEVRSQIANTQKSIVPSIRSYGSLQSLNQTSKNIVLRKTKSMLFRQASA